MYHIFPNHKLAAFSNISYVELFLCLKMQSRKNFVVALIVFFFIWIYFSFLLLCEMRKLTYYFNKKLHLQHKILLFKSQFSIQNHIRTINRSFIMFVLTIYFWLFILFLIFYYMYNGLKGEVFCASFGIVMLCNAWNFEIWNYHTWTTRNG